VFPAVLLIAVGLHVPEIPFKEVGGKLGATVPEQNGGITLNVGTVSGVTLTLIVTGSAHVPAFGVNV
jgi:hypothetical protein